MSRDAYRRAERCFALARSTTFPGERQTAIARGTSIASKAGLSLDEFDIPGRQRKRVEPVNLLDQLFTGSGIFGSNFQYVRTVFSGDDIAAQIDELVRRSQSQTRELDEERRRRRFQLRVDNAVDFLRARGNVVRRVEGGYSLDGHGLMAEAVLREARARGFRG